jgi:hypothetical protein
MPVSPSLIDSCASLRLATSSSPAMRVALRREQRAGAQRSAA